MPKFRNGNRRIDAFREASGDWLVIDMKKRDAWPEEDRVFRGQWEPADPETYPINTHGPNRCQAHGCHRPISLPATGDLCLSYWTREHVHGETVTRKSPGRGGDRTAHQAAQRAQKRRQRKAYWRTKEGKA